MDIIPSFAIILVARVPRPKDLEIARLLGWYRIPMKNAPILVDVDYIAFYQPGSFGAGHRWRIEFIAEVKGHELTTREDLFREEPDHPRAKEAYFKIQLAPLIRLDQPIKTADWKRLTFLYTLGDIFMKAETLDDLILKSEQRQVLWKTIKERLPQDSVYHYETFPGMDVDASILAFLGNIKPSSDSGGNGQD